MLMLVALFTFQVRVVWPPPTPSALGEAVNDSQTGNTCVVTVTGILQVAVRFWVPKAVSMYVAVVSGATVAEPSTATSPTPLLMVTREAFEVCHARVELPPTVIVDGAAVSESQVGAGSLVIQPLLIAV